MKTRTGIILLILWPWIYAVAQETVPQEDTLLTATIEKQKSLTINGYVKDMQALSFFQNFNALSATNLIHNRINIRWKPAENVLLAAEFRNRLIWGDDVKYTPDYSNFLRNPNERIDLSKVWFSNPSLVLHTNVDRLYVDYTWKKINLRLGRQRINWGIATVWNANDLFNTFNFLDFDYEERPGSDGVRAIAELGDFSGVELAYAPGTEGQDKVLAAKYFVNAGGYDIQLIPGIYGDRFTVGLGWAGSISDAGFKGEIQYFDRSSDAKRQLNLVLESDYVFSGGWYLNGGFLFNSTGLDKKIVNPQQVNFNFSPANLMPTKWNFMVTTGKEITPLLSANFSALYAPGTHLLLILPSIKYSLTENLSSDLVWQSFFATIDGFEALNHRGFLRIKYNF